MKEILSLETGYRTTFGGVLWTTQSGKILWANGGPIFPQNGLLAAYRAEVRESLDGGRTWGEPRTLLQSTAEYSWIPSAGITLTSGRLLLLSGQFGGYVDHDPDRSRMEGYSQFSDDEGKTWSVATKLPTGERYLAPPLSMTQISTGRVIYPYGYLTRDQGRSLVTVVFSDDEGGTWRKSSSILGVGGVGMESGALEPSVIELPDGRIWMLIRAQTGFQWESFSSDRGETWSEPVPSKIPSSNSPAVLTKLADGTILLTWNNCVSGVYARPSLTMATTKDGRTFGGFREIDHTAYPMTSMANQWGVMYPYLTEAADGTILVSYNYGDWTYLRAKLARLSRAWLDEKVIDYRFDQYGLGDWCTVGVSDPISSLKLILGDPAAPPTMCVSSCNGAAGAGHDFPLLTEGVVSLTMMLLKPEAFLLLHDTFLYAGAIDEACLRLRFASDGKVFIGAGVAETKEERQTNLDQNPIYAYRAYPVRDDVLYPKSIALGVAFDVTIRCSVSRGEASISIDGGPTVAVRLADVLGLCYLSVAASEGGSIELSKLVWNATSR